MCAEYVCGPRTESSRAFFIFFKIAKSLAKHFSAINFRGKWKFAFIVKRDIIICFLCALCTHACPQIQLSFVWAKLKLGKHKFIDASRHRACVSVLACISFLWEKRNKFFFCLFGERTSPKHINTVLHDILRFYDSFVGRQDCWQSFQNENWTLNRRVGAFEIEWPS